MPSRVSEIPALPSEQAASHYAARLAQETDCADVFEAMRLDAADFVLLDVRGGDAYRRAHVPGAVNLPHREISERTLEAWPHGTLFVVYCAGPHCNGADRAALRLAGLGRPVKVTIGGITGWADEGYAFARGAGPGSVAAAP